MWRSGFDGCLDDGREAVQASGISGPIPSRRGRSGRSKQQMHSMTEVLRHESPSMDMSSHLVHDSNASAPLLSGVALINGASGGTVGGTSQVLQSAATGPLVGGPAGSRLHNSLGTSRSDCHRHDTATALLLAGTGSQPAVSAQHTLARRSAQALRSAPMHSGRPSSPGAISTASAPLHDLNGVHGLQFREFSRGEEGPVDTAISAALSDMTDAAPDTYRQLTPATSALLPVVDEAFLSTKPSRRSMHGAKRPAGEHNAAQAMQDTLKTWVQQDAQLSTLQLLESAGDVHAHATSQELRTHSPPGIGCLPDSMHEPRPEASVYNTVQDLTFLSDLPEVEAEFGRWLEQYSAAFMDPMEEARLVEQYSAAMSGMHTSLCIPPIL